MRTIREIARLHLDKHLSLRSIARTCNLSVSTVHHYVSTIKALGLDYHALDALSERELQERFRPEKKQPASRPVPDMERITREMKRRGVTLHLLYEEYHEAHPDGYGTTRFYAFYNAWKQQRKATMRFSYEPGEVMFVDFSGDKPSWVHPQSGEIITSELYVATLGASSYAFACAVPSQKSPDFLSATIKALEYFGGSAETMVIDNLKSGVTHACYYDPEINKSFADLARHYNIAVLPTRPGKPKDKARVENAVLQVQRRILAPLRHKTFFSPEELNAALADALEAFNNRPMQLYNQSRKERFLSFEQQTLQPLPSERFVISEWKKAKVHIDYHVQLEKSYYSVPARLIGKQVDLSFSSSLVTIYHNGHVVARHIRTVKPGQFVTDRRHMPHEHQQYLEWTPERIRNWAGKIGPNTVELIDAVMRSKSHPEHAFRGSLGILRLAKAYSSERLEHAAEKALERKLLTYKSIKSMMESGFDKVTLFDQEAPATSLKHHNIRGGGYYAAEH